MLQVFMLMGGDRKIILALSMFNDVLKTGRDPNRGFGWRWFCLSYACFESHGYKYSS
jgi:hypothetical protein